MWGPLWLVHQTPDLSGLDWSPGWASHCVATHYSHSASLHPGVKMGTGKFNGGSTGNSDRQAYHLGEVKFAFEASGPSGWNLSRFL